jgi:5-formyltetrahydrofolate cyclo-ligase
MTKSELRKLYLKKRSSLTAAQIAESSQRIADRFFGTIDLSEMRTLHCFLSIGKFNELATSPIYEQIWSDFPSVRTAAPRIGVESGHMESVVFTAETQHSESTWGIREPAAGEIIEPAEIDVVLVPLLCFDMTGHRVGYGKGFYDRFLSKCRADCLKVGLSYFPPVSQITDTTVYDVVMDLCITPGEVFSFETV